MKGQRSVLIVDRSDESREVLQTVLERRGVHTLTAGRAEAGVELARQHHPELIVLDLESLDDGVAPLCRAGLVPDLEEASDISATDETRRLPSLPNATTTEPAYEPRLVLLGSVRGWNRRLPGGEFVAKPYHYGPLIRRIEELLAGQAQTETSRSPSRGQGTCRRYSSSAAPTKGAASN
ncbi:MAG: hypothetical protein ABFC96_16390 [Thermoguttaceae bacterium]